MKRLLQTARKDPQKTAGLTVVAILGIGASILWLGYLRRPAAAAPQAIAQKRPATRPVLITSMPDDAQIIQANQEAVERRRVALKELADARAAARARVAAQEQAALLELTLKTTLPQPATRPALATPATLPTTQASR